MSKAVDVAERFFLWPLLGGVTAVLGVIAGFLGSLNEEAVLQARYPWFWDAGIQYKMVVSSEATYFWISVALFGISLTGTFWAQARSMRKENAKLQSASSEVSIKADALQQQTSLVLIKAAALAETTGEVSSKADALAKNTEVLGGLIKQMHTLPPKKFLGDYSDTIRLAHETFVDAQGSETTSEELEVAIRSLLSLIVKLARGFDEDGQESAYGCNVMVYLPTISISAKEAQDVTKRLMFVDPGVTLEGLKGVLDWVPPLSVTSGSGDPDPTFSPFALPVLNLPRDYKPDGQDESVLPGAPLAFLRGVEIAIESPADWTGKSGHLSKKVQTELNSFFKSHDGALQSFVAIPLYADARGAGGPDPVGVLNIHRNRPNKLLAEKMELFAPLLTPITILLGRLVCDYEAKRYTQ